jgi:hypothetical protein
MKPYKRLFNEEIDITALRKDIQEAKRRLIIDARKHGKSDDFGQSEIGDLRQKYDMGNTELNSVINNFELWCKDYRGIGNESV